MEGPGQKLKKRREELNLRYRDVDEASKVIARRHGNDEFQVVLSRLSEIENHDSVPSIYRLYSLCAIYRLDLHDVMSWYNIDMNQIAADAVSVEITRSHLINFQPDPSAEIAIPLTLDPGVDFRKTTYLSRMIQRWGKLPLLMLNSSEFKNKRYAFVGTEDYWMYPLIQPGSLVLIDENRRKIQPDGWTNEFERPVYFLEHRQGYVCCWCSVSDKKLILQPHPASFCAVEVYEADQVDVIGQVTGVAMHLGQGRPPRKGF